MATKIAPSLETVERLIVEVEEWYERVRRIRQKMTCVERGSDPYQDLLSELSVELDWLKMKAEAAAEAIDEYHESLPEDDCERPVNPWRCSPDGYDVNSLTRGGTKTRAGQKGHEDNHSTTKPNSS